MGNSAQRYWLTGFVLLVMLGWASLAAACDGNKVRLTGSWGEAQFTVELADTPISRQRGLMHRSSMPRSAGMLFLFDFPHRARFWMKNTLIPLDLLFINEAGVVTRIHSNAQPLDLTTIDGGTGVIAVLEINGGLAEAMNIGVGSFVTHPFFDANTPWPCPE